MVAALGWADALINHDTTPDTTRTVADHQSCQMALTQARIALQASHLTLLQTLIQGDNKAIIDYAQGRAQLRSAETYDFLAKGISLLHKFLPACEVEYIPREANPWADHAAGIGSSQANTQAHLHVQALSITSHNILA